MLGYALKRGLSAIPVMAVVAVLVFAILFVVPGDPAAALAGDNASAEDVARIRHNLGLDRPFLVQLGGWLWRLLHGDAGTSLFSGQPVASLISGRLEPTLSIMALTILIAVVVAVPLGLLAAFRLDTGLDRLIMAGSVVGFSVPVFVVGYGLAYVLSLRLGWFPVQGYAPVADGVGAWLRSITLPSIAMATSYIALIARVARAATVEVLQQDFIRTVRAKGVGDGTILFVHALRNVAVPIAAVVGTGIAMLIGGAVVTESVFAIPGIGRLTVDAVLRRDIPVIQGIALFFSAAYVLVNLLLDIAYKALDPRVRY